MRVLGVAFFSLLFFGCGTLSTRQSPKVLMARHWAWSGGLAMGNTPHCFDSTGDFELKNGCVLTAQPYLGVRGGLGDMPKDYDFVANPGFADTSLIIDLERPQELGLLFSGVPFLGGSLLIDYRLQALLQPVFLSYDFGLSLFPCISSKMGDSENATCHDLPYGVGGNTWDGFHLLPGINLGSSLGTKRFKVIPSADVYFYQWPMDLKPSPRYIFGLGIQSQY